MAKPPAFSCRTFRKIIEKFLIFPLTQAKRTRSYNYNNVSRSSGRNRSNTNITCLLVSAAMAVFVVAFIVISYANVFMHSAPTTAILFMTSTMAPRKAKGGRGVFGGIFGRAGSCCRCKFMCIFGHAGFAPFTL